MTMCLAQAFGNQPGVTMLSGSQGSSSAVPQEQKRKKGINNLIQASMLQRQNAAAPPAGSYTGAPAMVTGG
jgi:hypothetical protein